MTYAMHKLRSPTYPSAAGTEVQAALTSFSKDNVTTDNGKQAVARTASLALPEPPSQQHAFMAHVTLLHVVPSGKQ